MVSTVGPKATREVPQPLEQANGRNPSSRTAAPAAISGDGPVHPAEGNLLRALLAQPRRPEQESQAEQAQHQAQDGPRQKFIPVEAHILRVLDALIDLSGGGELRPEKARQNHRLFAHRAGNIRGEAVSFLIFYQRHILKLLIRAAQLVQGKVPAS